MQLIDNALDTFTLPKPVCVDGQGTVRLRLSFIPGRPGATIAAWRYPAHSDVGFAFELIESGAADLELVQIDSSTGVRVWRNSAAFDRAFLAPDFEVVADSSAAQFRLKETESLHRTVYLEESEAKACHASKSSSAGIPGRLDSIVVEPNRVQVHYYANMPGVLTLTDAWFPGWHARVNNSDVPLFRVDGTFRGVCLERAGEYNVTFYYQPPLWQVSLALAAVGGLWILSVAIHANYSTSNGAVRSSAARVSM
jgi:hypothetical protein